MNDKQIEKLDFKYQANARKAIYFSKIKEKERQLNGFKKNIEEGLKFLKVHIYRRRLK